MSDSRARIWFASFVLVVFFLGGAGGFMLGRHMPAFPEGPSAPERDSLDNRGFARGRGPGRGDLSPPFMRGGRGGPAGLPPEMAGRLADELQLDDAQRAQFRQVLDDHRAKFERVHREARDRFASEQRELQQAIRAMLRPDQVERFDRFVNGRRP